jgi:endonuclease I
MHRSVSFPSVGVFALVLFVGAAAASDDPYAPPAGYYGGVTGTGAALHAQLGAAMAAGHLQRSYGDYRFAARLTDTDPNDPSRIILVYNGASVPAIWDSGVTWNREHVWPQSLQPGSASNSSTGNLGDPHALRPSNPSINSSRGNKPFGDADTTGGHRSLGAYYFPGDADKGDIARSLFYSDTRYASSGLRLVDTFPVGFQMGGLSALVAWHYLDAPDTFERRRNHTIFSQQANPAYYTNNRNAFVDLPGVVWSVYVNQQNDSTLFVGPAPDADGASSETVVFNTLVGADAGQEVVVLNKSGVAGTYFEVTVDGPAVSSLTGVHNAFPIGTTDTQRSITINAAPGATDAAGAFDATVTVDNLDVTLQGGPGVGGNDADDVILVELNVYEPAVASFDPGAGVDEIMLDLGVIGLGSGDAAAAFDLFNIAPAATGAPMDIDLVSAVGDTAALTVAFDPVVSLPAGAGELFVASLSDESEGDFEAVYTFRAFNDRGLVAHPGPGQDLTLRLTGTVGSAPCPADLAAPFGTLNFFDLAAYLSLFTARDPAADLNNDALFNFFDVSAYIGLYNAGCP